MLPLTFVVVSHMRHGTVLTVYVLTLGKRYARLDPSSSALFADINKVSLLL